MSKQTSSSSSSHTSTMTKTYQKANAIGKRPQKHQIFMISADGVHLTKTAAEHFRIADERASANTGDIVIHRKLLWRRYVRRLQKERALRFAHRTANLQLSMNYAAQLCSRWDMQLPRQRRWQEGSSLSKRVVFYPNHKHGPMLSPIRPRTVLPSVWSERSKRLVPPMSPIHAAPAAVSPAAATLRLPDLTTFSGEAPFLVGVKRKLDSEFL